MNRSERSAQKPSTRTGLLVALAALLGGQGSSASSPASRSRWGRSFAPAVLAMLTFGVALTAGAAPAFAGPLTLSKVENLEVFPTHASASDTVEGYATNAEVHKETEESDFPKWRAEYSTSKSVLEKGEGILASSGHGQVMELGSTQISSGNGRNTNGSSLAHLAPDTVYYARFVAETLAGEHLEEQFEFKTLPVAAPESSPLGITPLPTSLIAHAFVESNGAETKYSLEYAPAEAGHAPPEGSASWKLFTSGEVSGTVTVAEDFAEPVATVSGLTPESTYYVRVEASNGVGAGTFPPVLSGSGVACQYPCAAVTSTARPVVEGEPKISDLTGDSAHFEVALNPSGSETKWRFESAASASGPWTPVAGASGTISQAEAEALEASHPTAPATDVDGRIGGLKPESTYYVRLFAENVAGEGEDAQGIASFTTYGAPVPTTFATHSLDGESLRLLGAVDPDSGPMSSEQSITVEGAPTGGTFTLTFDGDTTGPLGYEALAGEVQVALTGLAAKPELVVEGAAGGPYTVTFKGDGNEPSIEADGSGLTPSGSVTVALLQAGGEYDAEYRFQYVSQKQFEESGWGGAGETAVGSAGGGQSTKFAAGDLPELRAGETYRYRLVASNDSPGDPTRIGQEQTLTVPVPTVAGEEASCPNEAFRVGPSAGLPDCRGYEQITPRDKEGTHEIFSYGPIYEAGAIPAEDGQALMLEDSPVNFNWGSGPMAGGSPYFFARQGDGSWQMTAAAIQPETGNAQFKLQLLSPDLNMIAFESRYNTSPESHSADIEFRVGPPGGPYTTVASVPFKQAEGSTSGWVASSQDFSKLILAVEDRTLAGAPTGTKQGNDLYEYAGGELRQVNVTGAAGDPQRIGTCGAQVARGAETTVEDESGSPHSLSTNGSRVFFEAVPGEECSKPSHLYVRIDGGSEAAQTIDIGAYKFLGANAQGTEALIEGEKGEDHEILVYNTETQSSKTLFTLHQQLSTAKIQVDEDFNALYFYTTERLTPEAPAVAPELAPNGGVVDNVYRYDIPSEKLTFVVQAGILKPAAVPTSPEGRYFYFKAQYMGGVPEGAEGDTFEFNGEASKGVQQSSQVYRYDSTEGLVQCVSCASSFDTEPKMNALFSESGGSSSGVQLTRNGLPQATVASANGDFVFFSTDADLLPNDVSGEVPSPLLAELGTFSLSSQVYEWRKPGIDGCTHVQGCLALITNGLGGYMNIPLGTTPSGEEVFFYSYSQLGPNDHDHAGDIYDARVDGGEPPAPARSVECEADACSTPPSAPSDATPSSLTFTGAGNLAPVVAPAAKAPAKKTAKKKVKPKRKKPNKKVRSKAKQKPGKRATKSDHRRSR